MNRASMLRLAAAGIIGLGAALLIAAAEAAQLSKEALRKAATAAACRSRSSADTSMMA